MTAAGAVVTFLGDQGFKRGSREIDHVYQPAFTQDFIWEYRQPSGNVIYYTPLGMCYPICQYFKDNGIEYDGIDTNMFRRQLPHTFEQFKEIVDSWGLSRKLRPYQYESAYKILRYRISLSELATRAGKTLISYASKNNKSGSIVLI